MRRCAVIVLAALWLMLCSTARARTVHCANSQLGDGTPTSRERASNVSCRTVHHLLGRAWLWRWGAVVWGGVPHSSPGGNPRGWACRELREYFSTGNATRQDDGTLIGSETRCTASHHRAFRFTQGQVTQWSHSLHY